MTTLGWSDFVDSSPALLSEVAKRVAKDNAHEVLSFAEWQFALRIPVSIAQRVRSHFGAFLADPGVGDRPWSVEVESVPPTTFRSRDCRGWEQELGLEAVDDQLLVSGHHFAAWADLKLGRATLFVRDGEPSEAPGALENLLRVLVARRALGAGGVLLHSVGVAPTSAEGGVDGSGAVVFAARSGTGKSTLAANALRVGHAVLSDDLNLLLPRPTGGWHVTRVPFSGDFQATADLRSESWSGVPVGAQHPLLGIGLLEQGRVDELVAISPGRLLAGLMACSPFVNSEISCFDLLSQNLMSLANSVPSTRARVARETDLHDLWEFVR